MGNSIRLNTWANFMSNLQTIFDTVVNHLRNQGCKSLNDRNLCRYRTQDSFGKTLMCAAGCLIPDKDYKETFEGEYEDRIGIKIEFKDSSKYHYYFPFFVLQKNNSN